MRLIELACACGLDLTLGESDGGKEYYAGFPDAAMKVGPYWLPVYAEGKTLLAAKKRLIKAVSGREMRIVLRDTSVVTYFELPPVLKVETIKVPTDLTV